MDYLTDGPRRSSGGAEITLPSAHLNLQGFIEGVLAGLAPVLLVAAGVAVRPVADVVVAVLVVVVRLAGAVTPGLSHRLHSQARVLRQPEEGHHDEVVRSVGIDLHKANKLGTGQQPDEQRIGAEGKGRQGSSHEHDEEAHRHVDRGK